jgi:hypothetical protein
VAVDADGVHVGREDGGVDAARRVVGRERIVGASCYDDFALAESAVAAGADYVAFGSFFPSTRQARRAPRRPSLLARAAALGVPVVAIGGIDARMSASSRGGATAARGDLGRVRCAGCRGRGRRHRRRVRLTLSRRRPARPSSDLQQPSKRDQHESQRRALRARATHDPRRRQFAGARVPLRRRHAAFLHAR